MSRPAYYSANVCEVKAERDISSVEQPTILLFGFFVSYFVWVWHRHSGTVS